MLYSHVKLSPLGSSRTYSVKSNFDVPLSSIVRRCCSPGRCKGCMGVLSIDNIT